MEHWLRQTFIAFDQLMAALLGGWADETLSSWAYRADRDGNRAGRFFRRAIDLVFLPLPYSIMGGPGHCERAYKAERIRNQLPPELR